MDDKTFCDLFEPFYRDITFFKTNLMMRRYESQEYVITRKHLEVLIPIYNRLTSELDVTIDHVLGLSKEIIPVDTIITNPPPTIKVEEPEEIDEEGDRAVKELNDKANETLKQYLLENRIEVESVISLVNYFEEADETNVGPNESKELAEVSLTNYDLYGEGYMDYCC
jgi:hypothetical protein